MLHLFSSPSCSCYCGNFILYPSQQPPAPPESPQSGFSCIWTRRSALDSSSPQPQPPPALPDSSQSGFSWIWRRRRTSRSELGISSPQPQPPSAPPESQLGLSESSQSGFSWIWTSRSELDSSSPQPRPPPALPDLSQSVFSCIWRRRRTSRSELGSSSAQPQPPPAQPESSQSGFSWTWTSRSELDSSSPQPPPPPPIGLKSFTYEELKLATNGFSESNLVGEGGFGCVYRGFLRDHGIAAIKKHRPNKTHQGVEEFHAEVHITSRVHHRHIVSLVGYYDHQVKTRLERPLMLVYEFLPNNSLQFHLHGRGTETIDWKTRMKIAVGSAKGLTYLHEVCKPKIIHRDIKPSNILLDENFQPKITDFGLARLLQDDDSYISMSRVIETDRLAERTPHYDTTAMAGTPVYMDPEYFRSGRISEKSDVYSFGVVLFELITGRKPWNDPEKYPRGHGLEWAGPLFSVALQYSNFEELADARLGNEYNAEEMFRMVSCAANCVRRLAARRPQMSQVVQVLEGVSRLDNDDLNDADYPTEWGCLATYIWHQPRSSRETRI